MLQVIMKKATLIFLALFFITIGDAFSQRWKLRRYEAIVGLGTTTVYGDIGGTADESNLYGLKDIRFTDVRPSYYLGIRYKLEEEMSIKLNLIYGQGYGTDAGSKNENRNLGFKTGIFEYSVQYEYFFLKEDRRLKSAAVFNRKGMINNYAKTAAYAFAGLGGIYISPKFTEDPSDVWPEWETTMKDRHIIEGYSKISATFPVGLGLKYTIDDMFTIGFELGGRYTLSDYLDGIAAKNPPFNNEHKDVYYFADVSLIYKVRTDRRGRPVLFR